MTEVEDDNGQRRRRIDNGRIARLADNPNWRFWPRVAVVVSPFVLMFVGWLLHEVWTSQTDAIKLVGGQVGEVQESVSRLVVQTEWIQAAQNDLEYDIEKLESRVHRIEVQYR